MNYDVAMNVLKDIFITNVSENGKTAILFLVKLTVIESLTPKDVEYGEALGRELAKAPDNTDELTTQDLLKSLRDNRSFNHIGNWPAGFGCWLFEMAIRDMTFQTESLHIRNLRLLLPRRGLEQLKQVFPHLKYLEFVDNDEMRDKALSTLDDIRDILSDTVSIVSRDE